MLKWALGVVLVMAAGVGALGQDKGVPGKFDFYVMNVAWGPQFCGVPGAGPDCKMPAGFVLHGLWTQNFDGSYPVNCAELPGPKNLKRFLDMTPDLPLLQHEWDKHGTCTTLKPEAFFAAERKTYTALVVPAAFKHFDKDAEMKTAAVVELFAKINAGFPAGSILLSCNKEKQLTAVEACFTKDLRPMVCRGLPSCTAEVVKSQAAAAAR